MNLWIAKLGGNPLTESEIEKFKVIAGDFKSLNNYDFFQFKSSSVHYLSVSTAKDIGKKKYHFEDNGLYAYSGLPVGKINLETDYRDVKSFKPFSSDLSDAFKQVDGQFALIKSTNSRFECVSDTLGVHKIFYHQCNNGEVFVSNYIAAIQAYKLSEPNLEFYATWISSSGIYGYDTEETDVSVMPEFGRLVWTDREGLTITQYSELSTILIPDGDVDEYVEKTAEEYKTTARYLSKYHQSVLTLSGGYDSRLVLEMFSGLDKSNLQCYTYPDGETDTVVAREVAKYHEVEHQQLEPVDIIDRKKVDEYLLSSKKPFICYSNIFGYQFSADVENIFNGKLKVLLKGDGGDTPTGLKKYSPANKHTPEKAINKLVEMAIKRDVLLPEAEALIREKMRNYYSNKYESVLMQRGSNHNIASIFYFLERFGSYQSHKLINSLHIGDLYLPFANINFLKAVFSAPEWMLYKSKEGSIHHLLHNKLTENNRKSIHFASNRHWNESRLSRINFVLQNKIKRLIKSRPPKRKASYSAELRDTFFDINKVHFKEVIHSSSSSQFWSYFNKDLISEWIENTEELDKNQKKVIFRVVPLLKFEFRN